ncbi:MAG: polyprenyl synthetase family protein [Armatimonadota bacterium]
MTGKVTDMSFVRDLQQPDIKHIPPQSVQRDAIRQLAGELAPGLDCTRPPIRQDLERLAVLILEQLSLPDSYRGFTMVAVSNAFWHEQFAAIPYTRRLFLLPHCLRNKASCAGTLDSVGLHCEGCGVCNINALQSAAEALGYRVVVAEGVSTVFDLIFTGEVDAVLGVACLDSLERSFQRMADLGIPHQAVPLLRDGCLETEVEGDIIQSLLQAKIARSSWRTQCYVPLLREAVHLCEEPALAHLLSPHVTLPTADEDHRSPLTETDRIAIDWLKCGGKRLRPFVTLAAYALTRFGTDALDADTAVAASLPDAVKRVALAIEVLHKASLVHDDIEDGDAFRYGRCTLHQTYGIGPALNVGDYLVGLGYRLITGETATLGADCVADILGRLSAAHLDLSRGQGAELLWQKSETELQPRDVLAIYALKTTPAFEVALSAGLRMAGTAVDDQLLRRYATFLGEAYQIRNDLDDWQWGEGNKLALGRDVLVGRPTILHAFALEAGGKAALAAIRNTERPASDQDGLIRETRQLYEELGVFQKTEMLLAKLRSRALMLAGETELPELRDLLTFLVRIILPEGSREKNGSEHGVP